ncbi:galactose mutarotase-like protein [Lophium mytilinum]|uniref:Galactose mutarotase-like protein n=1 Tax=Lophium mytilinum TaxID=390894 RepID=A0A6A6R6J4_9PEZI|nr:galactose mutarotase-like protein [Lophium mytilinum]
MVMRAFGAHFPARVTQLPGLGEDGKYTLSADGIRAQFIPYAATLTNLSVKDKNGIERDIVLGYDNASYYPVDSSHPVYNGIPGPYVNRIGNGTFTPVRASVTYTLSKNKWSIKIEAASLKIVNIPLDAVDDFYSAPHQLGFADSTPAFVGHCGGGGSCDGYNGEWLVDAHTPDSAVKLTLASEWSGIKADLRTDQEGLVVYTCFWSDGSAQIKAGQGYEGGPRNITSGDCVAIEAQDWVDGINHPEWGRLDRQIWGPGERYSWEAEWEFGIV